MDFASLGLSAPLLHSVAALGYKKPTTIQVQAIPPILAGRDLIAAAQTGTGKTAAFLLPLLHRLAAGTKVQSNQVRCLVLVPTRELASQVKDSASTYGNGLNVRMVAVFGGVKINPQMMALRKGADLLVATPGRLLDLVESNAIRFHQLEALVLDEADKMLNLGFAEEINAILSLLPKDRQNLMFSATFSPEIRQLASKLSRNALEIAASPANTAAKTVKQWLCPVDKKKKPQLLTALIRRNRWRQVLVFVKTKDGADQLCRHLDTAGFPAVAIHGNKSQGARTKALTDFKEGAVDVLVATDIAARGLDIDDLPVVVNFDLPKVAEDYIHRIGRTGRAGGSGEAVSLVCADEFDLLNAIEQVLGKHIAREEEDGFEPKHHVPASRAIVGPRKPKKPKKPKVPGEAVAAQPQTRPHQARAAGATKPPGKRTSSRRGPAVGKPAGSTQRWQGASSKAPRPR